MNNGAAEQSVLGAILLRNDALERVLHLSPDDFFDPRNRVVFEAMLSLHADDLPIDVVLLQDRLGEKVQAIGGLSYLSDLATLVPTADNITYYAEVVATAARTRRVRLRLSEIASNMQLEGPELLARAEQLVTLLRQPNASDVTDTYCSDLRAFIGEDEPTDEEEAEQWIVKGILARAVPNLFVGGPKASKTLIGLHIAICVSAGYPWMGFPTTCDRVLFLAHEDPQFETRRRIWRIARSENLDPRTLSENLIVRDRTPPFRFDEPRDVERMERTLKEFHPGVVFVDSLSRAHRVDENSVAEMKTVTDMWMDLCTRYNTAFVSLHHTNKSTGSVRGSGEIFAAARHMVSFTKKDDVVTISTDGNMASRIEPFAIDIRDNLVDGHKTISLTRNVAPTVDPEVAQALDKKILSRLSIHGPANTTTLRTDLKCSMDVLMVRLTALKETGAITRPTPRHKWLVPGMQGKQGPKSANGSASNGSEA